MSIKNILAIDLGTSGPKVALLCQGGQLLAHEFESVPLLLPPNGGAEQRPEDWWKAIKRSVGRLLAACPAAVPDIAAISCTAQWSGTVAVDSTGQPLMNAIIWMDSRGAPHVRRITSGPLSIQGYGVDKLAVWLRLTGGLPGQAGKDPIAHILYIKHELPEVYRATYKFLEPKDYLNLRLTGLFAASTDSITLHWLTDNRNLSTIDYDSRLLRLSTLDREKLPDLKRAIDILGPIRPEVAAELGLPQQVQVVMGTPDVHSAAIGSGAVRDYEGHLYIGTSSWIAGHVPFKKTDVLHAIASLPAAIPNKYLVTNEQQTAGACLTFLRDNLLYPPDPLLATDEPPAGIYQEFDRLAAQAPPGSSGVIFTPWLYGERTPVDDRFIRAGFHNLSLSTSRSHLVRAVLEGVALNSRWLLNYIDRFLKRPLEVIHLVGGGANSDIWCQIFADVLNRTVKQIENPILVNVQGAGFLGAVALGTMTFDDVEAHTPVANVYKPTPAHRQVYEELFTEFVNLYKRNRRMHARLNRNRP